LADGGDIAEFSEVCGDDLFQKPKVTGYGDNPYSITLQWNEIPSATEYKLWMKKTGSSAAPELIHQGRESSYTVSNLDYN
jgi:hypothetical protein